MNTFNVKEIQYLNRDYCVQFSKPFVYLHYMDHASKYPSAAYQQVLKKEPFTDESTEESIVSEFKDYVNECVNVSSRCRLMTFVKDFQLEYPNIIDDIEVYPNYNVEIVDLSNNNDSQPDLGVVWEINRIAPAFCGMLFENIIGEVMNVNDKIWDLSPVMCEQNSNVSTKTIEGILERNFISKKWLRGGDKVKVNSKKWVLVGDEKLDRMHFITDWHYLVFLSLQHFMKRDLKGSDVENALNVLDYVKNNMEYMDEYLEQMSQSTFVKNFSKDTMIKHGEIMRTSELSGECDFISDQSIVDIKCYKDECIDDWFGQLWLYEKLFGKRKNLWIVNVYSNKIYKFSHK